MKRLMVVLLAFAVTIPVGIKSRQSVQEVAPAAFRFQSSAHAIVRISGDVHHPGIYDVSANMLAENVILLAEPTWKPKGTTFTGIYTPRLKHGTELTVTRNVQDTVLIHVGMIPNTQRVLLQIPLDISTMKAEDFQRLPGIGPVLAERIISYRQKNGDKLVLEDLLLVEGIGEKKYNQLKRYFK